MPRQRNLTTLWLLFEVPATYSTKQIPDGRGISEVSIWLSQALALFVFYGNRNGNDNFYDPLKFVLQNTNTNVPNVIITLLNANANSVE